jgi:RNA polymerase sigma-70 factor (ECF subfamily)
VDDETVRRAQRGDTLALTAVLDALLPYVGRVCASVALDDGEDAAQEALVIVLRSLPTLQEPAALWAWARRIAVREALRAARRRERIGRPTDPADLARAASALADATTAVEVRSVLEGLPAEQRVILALRHLDGLGDNEIAALLDVPAGTVKSRLFRARAAMRARWTA